MSTFNSTEAGWLSNQFTGTGQPSSERDMSMYGAAADTNAGSTALNNTIQNSRTVPQNESESDTNTSRYFRPAYEPPELYWKQVAAIAREAVEETPRQEIPLDGYQATAPSEFPDDQESRDQKLRDEDLRPPWVRYDRRPETAGENENRERSEGQRTVELSFDDDAEIREQKEHEEILREHRARVHRVCMSKAPGQEPDRGSKKFSFQQHLEFMSPRNEQRGGHGKDADDMRI